MNSNRNTPVFNLKAVVRETGLKPETLRAWERRYGIPSPRRAASGHRLYSQAEVDMLHWLRARQDEGLSISRAVEMWNRMTAEAAASAAAESAATIGNASASHGAGASPMGAASGTSEMRRRWITACMRFDEQAAEQTLAQAFALFPPETVLSEIVQRGLASIGEGWYEGEVTVQQEHFASALALRRVEAMLVSSALPTRAGRILIACPAEEEHTYAPLALSLLLRRRGWDTVYLGANVPLVDFEATVATTRPSLVVMTAQQLYTAANLAEAADLLFEKGIPLAFGGLIFSRIPQLAESIAGHYLGDSLDGAVEVVEVLMRGLTLKPAHRVPSAAFEAALAHYRERLPLVEAEVWRRLENSVIPQRMLAQANLHFGRNLAAALALGDVDHLSVDVEWVEGMLVHHAGMPVDYVDGYLETYVEAMRMTMDERGRPAIDGLVKLLGIEPSPNASQSSQTTHIAS